MRSAYADKGAYLRSKQTKKLIKGMQLHLVEGLGEIGDDVVDVLRADAEADGCGSDVLTLKLFRFEL